ncbi:MAG: MbnP family protein [Ginsengibacter sp.]
MNKIIAKIYILACLFVLVTSFQNGNIAQENSVGAVKIIFINMVKNYKIALRDSVYTNSFGENYTINKFRYYISNISFKGAEKNFGEKNSFHLIDESVLESQSFSFSVPEGSYSSLNFLLGVDSLHNVSGAQTGELDPAKDMFWTWNSGYVMAKLEGNSPSSSLVNHKYEFHIGGYSGKYNVLKNIELHFPENKTIKVTAGQEIEIQIVADVDTWWQNTNDIKIAERANIMTPGKFALAISENYANMFHIEKIITE